MADSPEPHISHTVDVSYGRRPWCPPPSSS